MAFPYPRKKFKAPVLGLLSLLVLGSAAAVGVVMPASAAVTDTYAGVGTWFDKVGDAGGACGVPPAEIESKNFVALNVWDMPNDFAGNPSPRPIPADKSTIKGMYDNGLNCGRWVQIKLSDFCSVANGGAAGEGICRGGTWKPDKYNGATLNAVVTDSCGDGNEWCRSDRNHLDVSRYGVGKFTMPDGKPAGDLIGAGAWNNRKIEWSFIPAPNYQGDIKLAFAEGAERYYAPLIISNLPNGIHGVEYFDGSTWRRAEMNGDNGQRYTIDANSPAKTSYTIRVIDANDEHLNGGREYTFGRADCAQGNGKCSPSQNYNPVTYTTKAGSGR
ncbi:cellulose-binding protein [Streptomyces sp. NPDC088147]|uniref:cellulose-binding protein n=1 Tax=Streptomyces sp. NPDC088147 TaxID=3365830 RepID=UPI00381363AD